MSEVKMKMMDGNEAAASVAHRMNEVCVIYPITPVLATVQSRPVP